MKNLFLCLLFLSLLLISACGNLSSSMVTPISTAERRISLVQNRGKLTLYFGNGVAVTEASARRSLADIRFLINNPRFSNIKQRIDSALSPTSINYDLAYNIDKGVVINTYQAIAQKLIEAGNSPDFAWQYTHSYLIGNLDNFLQLINDTVGNTSIPDILPLGDFINGELSQALVNYLTSLSTIAEQNANITLANHIISYRGNTRNDDKAILIGHSQGTLLGKLSYEGLGIVGQSNSRSQCNFAGIGVANVLGSSMDGNNPYLYSRVPNDSVVNGVASAVNRLPVSGLPNPPLPVLPPPADQPPRSFNCGAGSDPLNHSFDNAYFCINDPPTGTPTGQIMNFIAQAAESFVINTKPGCGSIVIVRSTLPSLTNDGSPQPLTIQAKIVDPTTDEPLYSPGKQPPLRILLSPVRNVTLRDTSGLSDGDGNFVVWTQALPSPDATPIPAGSIPTGSVATLTANLLDAVVQAEVRPLPSTSETLRVSLAEDPPLAVGYAGMGDPCDFSDLQERFICFPAARTDPNLVSFDGWQHYTNDAGDYIYTRTLDGKVELQARHNGDWGVIEQMALRDGSDGVVIFWILLEDCPRSGDVYSQLLT